MIPGATFSETTSAVMSRDGEPAFEYHVFDYVDEELGLQCPYDARISYLRDVPTVGFVCKVLPVFIANHEELLSFEEKCLAEGHEGVMLRHGQGPYKCGRSTLKEGYLLKVKRFVDSEAEILGFEELMINQNEQVTNELGQSERSTHKAGMVPGGTLGKFFVRDIKTGVEFSIGSGLNVAVRKQIWADTGAYLGKLINYKFQPIGVKDKPRSSKVSATPRTCPKRDL